MIEEEIEQSWGPSQYEYGYEFEPVDTGVEVIVSVTDAGVSVEGATVYAINADEWVVEDVKVTDSDGEAAFSFSEGENIDFTVEEGDGDIVKTDEAIPFVEIT